MATQPKHAQPEASKPSAPAEPPPEPKPESPNLRPDGPTIAEEQRARSEEIERMGVDAWVKAHDTRTEEEKIPRTVAGVTPPTKRE